MRRLFLLSMAFFGSVMLFIIFIFLSTEVVYYNYLDRYLFEIILGIASFIIGCAGIITFGIMLIKHLIGIFKK